MSMKCDRLLTGLCVAVLLLVGTEFAQADTLHGNASETQAAAEIRGRLKSALARWDLAACRREGENLARYNQAAAGRKLIDSDVATVDTRIRQLRELYNPFHQIQTLNAKKAVDESYLLIRSIAAKMAEDAATDLTLTLVTAPLPGAGKVVSEFGKAANDFLGNFDDSRKVIDRAKALRSLDAMARSADEQMKSLIPAVREAEKMRASLTECGKQFQMGAASVKEAPAAVGGISSVQNKARPFDGVWHTHRVHNGCCSYSADEDFSISTDADWVTTISASSFPGKGRVTGTTYNFSYGPGNKGTITLNNDGKTFTGSFSDSQNHRGTIQGRR